MKKLDLKYQLDDAIYRAFNLWSAARFHFETSIRGMLARNHDLKDRHKSQRCFIVGNGPSILQQPLEKLSGETVFACNYFYKHEKVTTIRPAYYFILDGKIKTGEWPVSMLDEVAASCPDSQLFLEAALDHKPDTYVFTKKFPVYWIGTGQIIYPGFDYPIDLTRRIGGDNVVKIALQTAIYMGFTEIYLLGIDGDGLFRDLIGQSSHFYEAAAENAEMDYLRMEKDLWFCTEGFRSWRAIAERFQFGPVRVYNATHGGLLNIFPRRTLEEALSTKSKVEQAASLS